MPVSLLLHPLLPALMPRPASLDLASFDPSIMISTTDGGAFLSASNDAVQTRLRGHMASSFGARQDGHDLGLPLSPSSDVAVFAPGSSSRMLLLLLDADAEVVRWSRLILTKENSDLQLRPTSTKRQKESSAGPTQSPLLGVFEEMWTRFPIVAAIDRDNLDLSIRQPRSLTLLQPTPGSISQSDFAGQWQKMVTVSLALVCRIS